MHTTDIFKKLNLQFHYIRISPFLKLPVKPIGTSRQFITPETYKVSLLRNTLVTIRERITGCELK